MNNSPQTHNLKPMQKNTETKHIQSQCCNMPMTNRYKKFLSALAAIIPASRIITDPLRTLAYGTDASFYRLIPQAVVIVESEKEVSLLISKALKESIALTFRAAGTSLSGQAVTDSVLVKLGNNWVEHTILNNGEMIRLQPGIIGAAVNRALVPYQRKLGPDPASIDAAMIGGIAANNASGMCCGINDNSYQTLKSMRIIFSNGCILDTADQNSRNAFLTSHKTLITTINTLHTEIINTPALHNQIKQRFSIKNTTGYSLNAFIDYDDPIDIIQYLMIGSEGTLGFISQITYHTVVDHPYKASALLLFPTIVETSEAVITLAGSDVSAVELMDRAALRSIENEPGIPGYIASLNSTAAALLVEIRDDTPEKLAEQINTIESLLQNHNTLFPVSFNTNKEECQRYWNIRKGLFPAVSAMRDTGTTVIIEDVAFAIENLASAVVDLQALFKQYAYHEAIIFGHALAGNLHFVFTQDFSTTNEIERYKDFMSAICHLVVDKYNGSLKAEHGTGRNIAPFVELEWGTQAYQLMQKIKAAFDENNILNPDVILSKNSHIHVENLKVLHKTDSLIDQCMECGFCEPVCPSKCLTLTPRQRIVVQREISALEHQQVNLKRLNTLKETFNYQGITTCAADGLCSLACPLGINTGDLTRKLRHQKNQKHTPKAQWIATHFFATTQITRFILKTANIMHRTLGTKSMSMMTKTLRSITGQHIPLWTAAMPSASNILTSQLDPHESNHHQPITQDTIVYFPSCASRTMGPSRLDSDQRDLTQVTQSLLQKAGYNIRLPKKIGSLCCGMPFESKGLFDTANEKLTELCLHLLDISNNGKYPIICDTSPCVFQMLNKLDLRLKVYDPIEFALQFLLPKLNITRTDKPIMLHITCSTKKQGLEQSMLRLAKKLSNVVIVPESINCCGFAGDLGFNVPELNASALTPLKKQIPAQCNEGVSTSRTCEIGLSHHSGITYHSILNLIDQVSQPKINLKMD